MKNCPMCGSANIDLKFGIGADGLAHCYAIECTDCKFIVRAHGTPDNAILWAEDIWDEMRIYALPLKRFGRNWLKDIRISKELLDRREKEREKNGKSHRE